MSTSPRSTSSATEERLLDPAASDADEPDVPEELPVFDERDADVDEPDPEEALVLQTR